MALHWFDYFIIAVIGLSVITGLFRGFVKELIALCIWVLAIWLALTYAHILDSWLVAYIKDSTARIAASFVIILLATLIVGGLLNALLSFILSKSGLSGTDRLLGMGFGFIRGAFIVSLLIVVIEMVGIVHQDYAKQSVLYPKFKPLVSWLAKFMPDVLQQVRKLDEHADKHFNDIILAP